MQITQNNTYVISGKWEWIVRTASGKWLSWYQGMCIGKQ